MKYITDFIVTGNIKLNNNYILLKLTTGKQLPEMHAGQFVEVRIDGSPATFLRRPISIHFVDREANELWLLIQLVGAGTRKLAELQRGQELNLIFPLGKPFGMPTGGQNNLLLIGGGVGIAPLLMLGAELKEKKYNPHFLIGARSKNDLLQLPEFEKYGKIYTTTEDGTFGEKGFVTHHSILQQMRWDKIYTCGPTPMMKAIAGFAANNKTDCEVSLENTMACGIGACLCCVTETKEGNKCVCTDGPVFNINELKWQI